MSVSVPDATTSYEEAVASGFYGARTDPLPDEIYHADTDPSDIVPALTAVDPAAQDPSVAAWTMTCTGTFPVMDKTKWRVVIVNADATEWESLDLEAQALDTLLAYFMGGPNYPDAAGAATVVLRNGDQDLGEAPFTWNYTGPPDGGDS
jgi:hypothetical protein